ncbi:hypothetical protein GCM10019059_17340 [Camelimonas fluminis]|uniref:Uncharacterized protein n=1 Tax=Camelimonas fluminis TaxID=1576911 RepID=A0ABV7UIP2_9HYPH|nr:hypothetical protein [Camelimonas fluminis]GHE58453.1 hypothetical protein GCM10019059_17340 [Camelimonas fluminis]
MSIPMYVRRLSAVTAAVGVLAIAPVAFAQQVPATPDWEAPADVKPSPKARGGAKAASRSTGATGGLNAPMRKIERDDIDMTGVGREVRNFGSGVRPMMNSTGGMGVGGGF